MNVTSQIIKKSVRDTKTGSKKYAFLIKLPTGEEKWVSGFLGQEDEPQEWHKHARGAENGDEYEFNIYKTKTGFWNINDMIPSEDVNQDLREEECDSWEEEKEEEKPKPKPKPKPQPQVKQEGNRDLLIIRQCAVKAACRLVHTNMPDVELKQVVPAVIKAARRMEKYILEGE